jgi:solute carrier family 25 phosphate transporter 3
MVGLGGGALACGLTHLAIVPLDILKCKMQIDKKFCTGFIDGIKKISIARQLTLGWVPTLYGYSIQGAGKFGFY